MSPVRAQTSADSAAVVSVANDYINGFFLGDTARMRRALHDDLIKRQVTGNRMAHQSANDLVNLTARMAGRGMPELPVDSILLLQLFKDIAMVKIGAVSWVDYLHLARVGSRWVIVDVLWQPRQ